MNAVASDDAKSSFREVSLNGPVSAEVPMLPTPCCVFTVAFMCLTTREANIRPPLQSGNGARDEYRLKNSTAQPFENSSAGSTTVQ